MWIVYCFLNDMGCEYFVVKDYVNVMCIFNFVIGIYCQEEWVVLLGFIFMYLWECVCCLGFVKEFVEYSFEFLFLLLLVIVFFGYVFGLEVEFFGELEKIQFCQEFVEFLCGVCDIIFQEGKLGMKLLFVQFINFEINV